MIIRLLCAFSLVASAQTARTQFEVATVKLNDHSDPHIGSGPSVKNGTFMAGNLTLKKLISYAFDVQEFQMKAPAWLESEHFDVTAKMPDGSPDAQARPMLRTLLEDRFHLKTHSETSEMSVYALVVGKSGSKLKEVQAGEEVKPPKMPPHAAMMMTKGPLSDFAADLAPKVGRPVVDKTGMTGTFRVFLVYASTGAAPADATADSAPDLFTAIQEQLGLKLEPQKGQVACLVIDSAEKVPEGN